MANKKCPKCNSDVENENRFCGKCGYDMQQASGEQKLTSNVSEHEKAQASQIVNLLSDVKSIRSRKMVLLSAVVSAVLVIVGGFIWWMTCTKNTSAFAYSQAQTALKNDSLQSAIIDLRGVSNISPYYKEARNQLTAVGEAQKIEQMSKDVIKDNNDFSDSYNDLSNDSTDMITTLTYIRTNFYSTDVSGQLRTATNNLFLVGKDSKQVVAVAGAFITELSLVQSDNALSGYDISGLTYSLNDAVSQSNKIGDGFAAINVDAGNADWSSYYSDAQDVNEGFYQLCIDKVGIGSDESQLIDYMTGAEQRILGTSVHLS